MNKRRRYKSRVRADVELRFRGLRGVKWRLTSRETTGYNCIAWAIGDNHRRWDLVDGYWPNSVSRTYGIESLVKAYMTKGFEVSFADGREFDPKYDKIVLYVTRNGATHSLSHAAKLMSNGMWSSKLGHLQDIQHPTPEDVICDDYGEPLIYMRKERRVDNARKTRKTAR